MLFILLTGAICAIIKQLVQQDMVLSALSPEESGRVLLIDPGHGGEDGGAVSPDGLKESAVNLDIALRLRALCGFFGVETRLTRETETLSYPDQCRTTAARKRWDTRSRCERINAVPDAVLLSIHQNCYPDPRPRGPQAFYGPAPGSQALTAPFHQNLTAALYPQSRRVAAPAPDGVYIMEHARCPAVLAECGFLSNPAEAALLGTGEYRLKIAAVLLASYLQYTEENHEVQNSVLLHGVRK